MRRSRQIGFRLTRGATSAFLAGSLLLVAPQAALADDPRVEQNERDNERGDDKDHDRDSNEEREERDERGDDRNEERPVTDEDNHERPAGPAMTAPPGQAEQAASDDEADGATGDSSGSPEGHGGEVAPRSNSTPAEPAPGADTAVAAASASRSPGDTAEAVTATTPSLAPSFPVAANRPSTSITPATPVDRADVNAAGGIEPATFAPTVTGLTSKATTGLPIDPLVPASLGLLLLARALRRPTRDDRKIQL